MKSGWMIALLKNVANGSRRMKTAAHGLQAAKMLSGWRMEARWTMKWYFVRIAERSCGAYRIRRQKAGRKAGKTARTDGSTDMYEIEPENLKNEIHALKEAIKRGEVKDYKLTQI